MSDTHAGRCAWPPTGVTLLRCVVLAVFAGHGIIDLYELPGAVPWARVLPAWAPAVTASFLPWLQILLGCLIGAGWRCAFAVLLVGHAVTDLYELPGTVSWGRLLPRWAPDGLAVLVPWLEVFFGGAFFRGWRFALRLVFGGLFLYTGINKSGVVDVSATAEFATQIANYDVLPERVVNPVAICLPWIEVLCGLVAILGWREAIGILIALMVVFTVGLVQAIIRKLDIECGCGLSERRVDWWAFAEDIGMLAVGVWAFIAARPGPGRSCSVTVEPPGEDTQPEPDAPVS